MIHGRNVSIGCIAVGDPGIEDLFVTVATIGLRNVKVIIAPNDLRVSGAPVEANTPLWIVRLWQSIAAAMREFPVAQEADASVDVRAMPKLWRVFKDH